jgi:hypothetical protein
LADHASCYSAGVAQLFYTDVLSALAEAGVPLRGFAHHHTDEELRAYAALTPEQKLRWLHEAWRFTVDFLPADRREAWMKMRRGEI